ncbi:MAG: bacterial Ig-like domain-containing protein, partial [Synergistaceae bacterium]|nr:bacterial Ig-like domain-containing protein [Synergistaceae bacterium]
DQWNENASGSFSLNVLTLQQELQITPPEKTSYRQGEAIDYTGATVTAVYSDGSTEDVTSYAVFNPANGTVITEDMTGSINVSVSYTDEWGENASGSLSLSIVSIVNE